MRQLLAEALLEPDKHLEAWHSRVTPNADNNSCPLPRQNNILFNKHS